MNEYFHSKMIKQNFFLLLSISGVIFIFLSASLCHGSTSINSTYTYRTLSDNFSSQNEMSLSLTQNFTRLFGVYGTARRTNLFQLTDTEFSGGIFFPLGRSTTVTLGGSSSPTNKILPKSSFSGSVNIWPTRSFHLTIGGNQSNYDTPTTDVIYTTVGYEGYRHGVSYTFSGSRLDTSAYKPSHTLTYTYYGNSEGYISLSGSIGEQPQQTTGGAIFSLDFYSLSIKGSQPLITSTNQAFSSWSLNYGLTFSHIENQYDSTGFNLGFSYQFK